MKKIAIVLNQHKDKELKYLRMLEKSIIANGAECVLSSCEESEYDIECRVDNDFDAVICLGGDGTFLKASKKAYFKDKPILGINLGNLGFLAEVDKEDIHESIAMLIKGEYFIEERMMLKAVIERNGEIVIEDTALNDVVISRGALSRIIHLKTYINNTFIDLFPGDGLIISSPTGSTGYSLSAGGPIVEPDINLIIVTLICPHNIYTRSFVTTGDRVIKVEVEECRRDGAMVTIDGQKGYDIGYKDIIKIEKSNRTLKLIKFKNRNFFSVLREKIYKRGTNN